MTGPLDGRLPGPVRQAMARLEQAGYRAYVVGGALRDLLLGGSPRIMTWPARPRPSR